MSQHDINDNKLNEKKIVDEDIIDDFDEDLEMKVLVLTQKMIKGSFGKKMRQLNKISKDVNSKNSQNLYSKQVVVMEDL